MLYFLNFLFKNIVLAYLLSAGAHAFSHSCVSAQEQKSCRACSSVEPAPKDNFYQAITQQDRFFIHLQQESLQKIEVLKNSKEFQEIVTDLQGNASKFSSAFRTPSGHEQSFLYIFVSFSLGEKALLNLAYDAKRFGATLVLRGFKACPHENGEPAKLNYLKTAQSLQNIIIKTGQGVIIDPEFYTLFNITTVPTFILAKPFQLHSQERSQTPIHDKLQGYVSAHYALETFAKEGDLKADAQELLKTGGNK